MDFKCLNNNVKLHYNPHIYHKLILYLDHPYYMILYLLIEMYLSEYDIPYTFNNNYILIHNLEEDNIEKIIELICVTLSTLLNYFEIELDLFNEIYKYLKNIRYFKLINFMFPNYNHVFDCKEISFNNVNKSIKYFFKNSQIYFLTSSKRIFNNFNFNLIKRINKKNINKNYYLLPYKKFKTLDNLDNLIGIYLNNLEYYEHYVLDLLLIILEKKLYICETYWISKNYKILIIPYICLNTLTRFVKKIKNYDFEIDINLDLIIKNKNIIDYINYKKFNLNIYNQISKDDIIKLSQKIFNKDNIKFLKK